MKTLLLFALTALLALSSRTTIFADDALPAGAARVSVTPTEPVQLINDRSEVESDKVAQQLYARALAIGADENVVVLITFDGIGVPQSLATAVADDLQKAHPFLTREQIAICATHTHWAPHLTDLLGNIYGGPLPEQQQKHVDAYTQYLRQQLTTVASEALAARAPSHLRWTRAGKVTFATNRRLEDGGQLIQDEEKGLMVTWNPDAPADHTLPLLAVHDAADGQLRALHFTYACHNVAITGATRISKFENTVHGDWAGLAQEEMERRHPGIVALGSIGCGGDLRPDFCGNEAVALAHAREICDETDRLLAPTSSDSRASLWHSITGPAVTRWQQTELPLEPLPGPRQLQSYADANRGGASTIARSFVARSLLRRIEQGKTPLSAVPFIAQSWRFPGDGPSFVFLSGEVCIDYQLRIKKEFGENAWPIAYANATPCYIVSERMLKKGGYEAGNSMFYYGWLRPLQTGAEEKVMAAVANVFPE